MDSQKIERLLHECECTFLDFKTTEYPFYNASDTQKSELLKDIFALANADTAESRFILMGVEERKGKRAGILGINAQLKDNDLQQFVNTKPLNKPIVFQYEVLTVDGLTIGIVSIPVQEGPFYLRADYGKLRKNIVYCRQGSSTAELTPDELLHVGRRQALSDKIPKLELSLAQVAVPSPPFNLSENVLWDPAMALEVKRVFQLSPHEIQKLIQEDIGAGLPEVYLSERSRFYQQLDKFRALGLMFRPIGLHLLNSGQVSVSDVRIALQLMTAKGIQVLSAKDFPPRPVVRQVREIFRDFPEASHTRLVSGDLTVRKHGEAQAIDWAVPKIIPAERKFSTGFFLIAAAESCTLSFTFSVLAENLPFPISGELELRVAVSDPIEPGLVSFKIFRDQLEEYDKMRN